MPLGNPRLERFLGFPVLFAALIIQHFLPRMLTASHPMEAHRVESRALFFMGAESDAREGIESFLEKRAPRFKMSPTRDLPDIFS